MAICLLAVIGTYPNFFFTNLCAFFMMARKLVSYHVSTKHRTEANDTGAHWREENPRKVSTFKARDKKMLSGENPR